MKKESKTIRGYKVFDPNFKCKDFQFSENKTFTHKGKIEMCASGFHFCIKASDCFNYYSFDSKNIVCEVEGVGEILTHAEDSKICTDKIKIGRVLSWQEVLVASNEGKDNTGRSNSGNSNSGNSNSGNSNSGNSNSGNSNSGNSNSGNSNSGNSNSGNSNSGNSCTGEKTIRLFNKASKMTMQEFENSQAYSLLCDISCLMWIQESVMTDAEKTANPSSKTTGGYLKSIPFKEDFQAHWHNWSKENKKAFTDLPNFDSEVFFEITGVKV